MKGNFIFSIEQIINIFKGWGRVSCYNWELFSDEFQNTFCDRRAKSKLFNYSCEQSFGVGSRGKGKRSLSPKEDCRLSRVTCGWMRVEVMPWPPKGWLLTGSGVAAVSCGLFIFSAIHLARDDLRRFWELPGSKFLQSTYIPHMCIIFLKKSGLAICVENSIPSFRGKKQWIIKKYNENKYDKIK